MNIEKNETTAYRFVCTLAVPSIDVSDTRKPFIITACLVGLVTFMIVFNLDNITELMGGIYRRRGTRLLERIPFRQLCRQILHGKCWEARQERVVLGYARVERVVVKWPPEAFSTQIQRLASRTIRAGTLPRN